jgi:hypothetical protein
LSRGLSAHERARIRQRIQPSSIVVKDDFELWNKVRELAEMDLGQAMLNQSQFRITEVLQDVSTQTQHIAEVRPSVVDNILLTVSLQAFCKSRQSTHSGDLLLGIPPFSYSLPIFMAYHLILHHLGTLLSNHSLSRFNHGSGILIVTDNIEILSHFWRTTVNGVFLRDFISVYTLESGKFRELQEDSEGVRRRNKKQTDETLPWLGLYRAYRLNLPSSLDRLPSVVILDFLPLRHRKRFHELVTWARQISEHVIALVPRNDDLFSEGTTLFPYVIPVDVSTISYLEHVVELDLNRYSTEPVTASWNIGGSLPYITALPSEVTLYKICMGNELEQLFGESLELISSIYRTYGHKPMAVERLHWILLDLLSLSIPLEWYERTRIAQQKRTLREQLASIKHTAAWNRTEEPVNHYLLPTLLERVEKIYTSMLAHKSSPKGEAVEKLIESYLPEHKRITVIVPDDICSNEIKIWLRTREKLTSDDLPYVHTISQSEWARNQLREIYFDIDQAPDVLIVVGPWHKKYLSSFYVVPATKVVFIASDLEYALVRAQITGSFRFDKTAVNQMLRSTAHLFDAAVPSYITGLKVTEPQVRIIEHSVRHVRVISQLSNQRVDTVNVSNILGIHVLQELLERDSESQQTLDKDDEDIRLTSNTFEFPVQQSNSVEGVRMELRLDSTDIKSMYVPVDSMIGVLKQGKQQVEMVRPLEIQPGDIWVRLKRSERQQLFKSLLEMASNTLTMKWIQLNLDEWKEMLRIVWNKFARTGLSKKDVYEKIACELRRRGGSVEAPETVSTWITGQVTSVRDGENVRAMAELTGENRFIDRWQQIHSAMRLLWSIHIQLGRLLARVILQQASHVIQGTTKLRWIDIGADIRIPVEDVVDALECHEIIHIGRDVSYKVPPALTNRPIPMELEANLVRRGIIRREC